MWRNLRAAGVLSVGVLIGLMISSLRTTSPRATNRSERVLNDSLARSVISPGVVDTEHLPRETGKRDDDDAELNQSPIEQLELNPLLKRLDEVKAEFNGAADKEEFLASLVKRIEKFPPDEKSLLVNSFLSNLAKADTSELALGWLEKHRDSLHGGLGEWLVANGCISSAYGEKSR